MEVSCGCDNLAFSANAGDNRGKVKILPAQRALAAMEKHKRLRLKLKTMDVQLKRCDRLIRRKLPKADNRCSLPQRDNGHNNNAFMLGE